EVLDDLRLASHRQERYESRDRHEREGEAEDQVEHAIPDRLPERVEGDGDERGHRARSSARARPISRRKRSSSDSRRGQTETTSPPALSTAWRRRVRAWGSGTL